jgi:hypothetical protein
MMLMLDQIVGFLFAPANDNPLFILLKFENKAVERIWEKGGNKVWSHFRKPVDPKQLAKAMTIVSEDGSGKINRRNPRLDEVYDLDSNMLIGRLPARVNYFEQINKDRADKAGKGEAGVQPGVSEKAIGLLKESLLAAASYLNAYLYSDSVKAILDGERNIIYLINDWLGRIIIPWVTKGLLSDGARKINRSTSSADLRGARITIANAINFADLTRIWFYQLGSLTELSPVGEYKSNVNVDVEAGKILLFQKDALATKTIKEHPFCKLIIDYTKCRINNDLEYGWKEFRIFFHYDFGLLISSLKSYDLTLNLLGSFTFEVVPDKDKQQIRFRLINNLSLESGSRFRKDPENGNIVGIFESHDRNYNLVLKKDQSAKRRMKDRALVDMGGTLLCLWDWTENLGSL